jgi:DNA-binding PadR family transcriptional regulator
VGSESLEEGVLKTIRGTRRGMSPAVLHMLLSLLDGDRHGYALKKAVERRTDGAVKLGPGTLYEAIARLQEDGWIKQVGAPEAFPPEDGQKAQRRYYRMTARGLTALKAEVERLGQIVDYARSKAVLSEREPA